MGPLIETLLTALLIVAILPILVAVHELGHFWVARACGMHVDAFAVMMGGIRKTRPSELGAKPMASPWILAAVGTVAGVSLAWAMSAQNLIGAYASLAVLGAVLPVWIATRLGNVYRLPLASTVGTVAKAWLVAVVLSFVGTGGKGMGPLQTVGLLAIFAVIGLLFVYYHPVLHKGEEEKHGQGQIFVDGPMGPEKRPVLFRPLLSRTDKHGTEFSLLCLPLGGFAAIRGMHPKEDGSETEIEGGFYSKPPLARLAVLFAGPFFSIAFGVLLLAVVLAINGELVPRTTPVIGSLTADGPGAKAGLKPGDKILEANGKPVATFYDLVKTVRVSFTEKDGRYEPVPVRLTYERDGKTLFANVTPVVDKAPSPVLQEDNKPSSEKKIQAKLQMSPVFDHKPLAPVEAFDAAVKYPVLLVAGLAESVSKPQTLAENIGGPASIAREIGNAGKAGPPAVFMVAAMLSVSLGVMNLLPIVPFDGGQMMVAFAELLRGGRRLSLKLQMQLSTIGAFLVMVLVIGVVTLDIGKMAMGR
ncbi:MAG: site-2 protease family protein [Armatimonadetes bacterium]|nr:site-2 protease family protein [Armatimonadota bacterium]